MGRGKSWWRKGVWVGFFVLVSAAAVEATLSPGTAFMFDDYESVGEFLLPDQFVEYTHILEDSVFNPVLEGGEVIDIFNAGLAVVNLNITVPNGSLLGLSAWFNGSPLGSIEYTEGQFFDAWEMDLLSPTLDVLENDRQGTIRIEVSGSGSVTVMSSVIVGEGMVVPEPASLLLLGAGLIGLAGFGRKKSRKEEEV